MDIIGKIQRVIMFDDMHVFKVTAGHDLNCHNRMVWVMGDICFLWKHCYIFSQSFNSMIHVEVVSLIAEVDTLLF